MDFKHLILFEKFFPPLGFFTYIKVLTPRLLGPPHLLEIREVRVRTSNFSYISSLIFQFSQNKLSAKRIP